MTWLSSGWQHTPPHPKSPPLPFSKLFSIFQCGFNDHALWGVSHIRKGIARDEMQDRTIGRIERRDVSRRNNFHGLDFIMELAIFRLYLDLITLSNSFQRAKVCISMSRDHAVPLHAREGRS